MAMWFTLLPCGEFGKWEQLGLQNTIFTAILMVTELLFSVLAAYHQEWGMAKIRVITAIYLVW
jgi:hypothetical protein